MERNREARRGSMAAMNGGLSRRRQRSGGLRDSPEEDGGEMEMAERTRLRDRGSKKERDRDRDRERERSSRSKRRRGERMMLHGGGGNRDEGEESSEESTEEEEDDDDDVSVVVRLPPPLLPPPNTASSSSPLTHNNHHHYHQQQQQQLQRKSNPAKLAKSPMVWKTDEMIGVAVPRKARSAATKRSSHEWLVSGSGVLGGGGGGGGGGSSSGGGGGDSSQIQRLSPPSISQISPSSSNASVRKKMKPFSGAKQRPPPKVSKPASFIQEEIEIAEVLFGMTRQFQNSKDFGEPKSSRASSPNSICLPSTAQPSIPQPSDSMFNPSSLPVIAPKRKRPRPVKFEDESPISLPSTSGSSAAKLEAEPQAKADTLLPKSEKIAEPSAVENGTRSPQIEATIVDALKGVKKDNQNSDLKELIAESDHHDQMASREEPSLPSMEALPTDSDVNHREASTAKAAPLSDDAREQKFSIDLMAPPPGKLSPERDGFCNYDTDEKPLCPEIEMVKVTVEKKEDEKTLQSVKIGLAERKSEKPLLEEFITKKAGELQHGLEKPEKESLSSNKLQSQKQQAKAPKAESRQDKVAPPASLSMSMTVGGWPGNFPHFGYVAQVPPLPAAVVPMDGNPGPSKALQGPTFLSMQPRPKRCATHCYIAQNIHYHQRIAKVNPLWPAAASTAPLYGGKPYNLNVMPPPDAAFFGGPIRGSFPGSTALDSKGSSMVAAAFPGNLLKEKTPAANNSMMEAAQRKQIVLEQTPQPGSAANMLHGPAFIFSLNQQQAAAAAAAAAAANLSGAAKSSAMAANGMPSPVTSTSATTTSTIGGPAAAMNLSFASLPHAEAQYLAILQNGAYPFPIAGGPPSYRGATPAQAMPFFNGPFYPSQMLHPSQLQAQQQQQQQQQGSQQAHQNTSSLSTPASSQKHSQQQPQRIPGGVPNGAATNSHSFPTGNQRPHLLPHQARQQDGDKCSEDSPTTADSRVSQAQNSISGYNFAMPIHPPNFALMSSAAAAAALGSTGGGHNGKPSIYQQQQQQQQHHQQKQSSSQNIKVDHASSQHFTMPFASFTGPGAAPAGLDFSSMAHNHSLFQSLPEAARHGYHPVTMAAAAPAQATQKKKAHHHQITEEGKSLGGDSASTIVKGEDERKMSAAAKIPGNGSQHSVSFSKTANEPPISSIICSSISDSSSRTINLIPSSGNGNRTANKSANAVSPTTISAATAGSSISISQQQQLQQQQQQHQHFIHLQKQQQQMQQQQIQMQQQQIQMQQQLGACRPKSSASSSNTGVYTEHLPAGSSDTKFPQALTSFSQALIHGGGSPSQSPQWKATNARGAAHAPAPAPSSASVVGKNNHLLQHQGRAPQQALPTPSHQTQISFGMNSSKMATSGANLSGGATNPSLSSASAIAVGSPSNSGSKSVSGSPRASASALPAPSAALLPLPQQPSVKNSASNSGSKSTPMGNRNMPSILGQPNMTPAPNSSTKQQQQQPTQLKQQPFNHSQLFFSNAYMQQAQSQANAAAAATGYYHRRQTELEQPQQQNSAPSSTGTIAICPSSLMVAGAPASADPAKTVAAAANKGIPSPGRLQTHLGGSAQSASPHLLNPASFPYISMPPVSMKSAADQKPAAGNDNLHACWQPEKK